jgi:hypothetical protein
MMLVARYTPSPQVPSVVVVPVVVEEVDGSVALVAGSGGSSLPPEAEALPPLLPVVAPLLAAPLSLSPSLPAPAPLPSPLSLELEMAGPHAAIGAARTARKAQLDVRSIAMQGTADRRGR